jgi:hypothetical protein
MNSVRGSSTVAKACMLFPPRFLSVRITDLCISQQNAKCAGSTPDGISWESSSLGMRLRRTPLPARFWIAGDDA